MIESIEEKMRQASLSRLAKFHQTAKEHPFRLDRIGSSKNYAEILDKLGDEFYALVKKQSIEAQTKFPFRKWIWAHQYFSCVCAIRGNYKHIEEYMVIMESYLQTIHAYFESGGKLNFFFMHVGYSSYNKEQHEDNPMRSLKFIFYPKFNEYDLTKFHAEKELVYNKRKLKEQHEVKKNSKCIEFHESRIRYYSKRIKRLEEIIKLTYNECPKCGGEAFNKADVDIGQAWQCVDHCKDCDSTFFMGEYKGKLKFYLDYRIIKEKIKNPHYHSGWKRTPDSVWIVETVVDEGLIYVGEITVSGKLVDEEMDKYQSIKGHGAFDVAIRLASKKYPNVNPIILTPKKVLGTNYLE